MEAAEAVEPWRDLMRTLQSWGMPAPPAPVALRPALQICQPKCWATRPIYGMSMYRFQIREAEQFLAGTAPDYLALSHAGHGVNSYAITYHLVYRGLGLFVQEGWGGIYADRQTDTASVADMFRRCQDVVDRWEAYAGDGQPPRRLLCVESRLRDVSACGFLPPDTTAWLAGLGENPKLIDSDGRDIQEHNSWEHPLRQFVRAHYAAPHQALAQAQRFLNDPSR
jgi:hypothetical protein